MSQPPLTRKCDVGWFIFVYVCNVVEFHKNLARSLFSLCSVVAYTKIKIYVLLNKLES